MILIVALVLGTAFTGGLWLTHRLIGETGRHAGRESFDWSDTRPLFRPARPDRVDILSRRWYLPQSALDELLRIDELITEIDTFLRTTAP